jgi:hypothetical protein
MNLKSLLFAIALFAFFSFSGYSNNFINSGVGAATLSYNSHIIDDDNNGGSSGNDNGLCQAGESIEMPVSFMNTGTDIATNAKATISCSDPDINITDDYEYIGTIFVGATAFTEGDYDFDVAVGTPEKDVTFNLNITSNEGTWSSSFVVHIYVIEPVLLYNDHNFNPAGADNDGLAEGGESITMPLSLWNDGADTARNVAAVLTCADADITITDANEHFADIPMNSEMWTNYDFNFDIASGILVERDVEFVLEITSDEGSWTSPFTVHIYPDNEAPFIDISYNDHRIDDNTSSGDNDGVPEAGEMIRLPLSLFNHGNMDATNVSAVLYCNDPDITLQDNTEYFGDMNASEEVWSEYSYDFEISATCPAKDVMFRLEITSNEGSWTSYFAISITTPSNAEMIYPNPSNGTFKLISTNDGGLYQYQLIDIYGNEIHRGEIVIGKDLEPVLQFDWLDTGIYFLKLDNGFESLLQKVIIQ